MAVNLVCLLVRAGAKTASFGAPWMVGDTVHVQGWFRDPPACKTTSLSNGAVLTYQP